MQWLKKTVFKQTTSSFEFRETKFITYSLSIIVQSSQNKQSHSRVVRLSTYWNSEILTILNNYIRNIKIIVLELFYNFFIASSSTVKTNVVLLEYTRLSLGARRMCACADAICNEQRRRWRVFYFETRYINVSLMLSDIAWKAKSFVNKRFVRRKLHSLFLHSEFERMLTDLFFEI